VNLWLADGAAAGQEVGHVHLHVVPRHAGDGFGFKFGPDYGTQPDSEQMKKTAALIAAKLEGPV
jgi:diadenosine tetraphosphate (Ap4A) HIT family hydrolase